MLRVISLIGLTSPHGTRSESEPSRTTAHRCRSGLVFNRQKWSTFRPALTTLSEDALAEAIRNTFAERGSHEPPRSLPSPSNEWRAPYRSLAESVGLHPDIDAGFAQSAMLLNPVLAKLA